MMRGVKAILDDCSCVKKNETVLIITDTKLNHIGEVLAAGIYEREAEPILTVIKPRTRDGQEPPKVIAEAMKHADLIIAPVSKSITHTQSVKDAVSAGARILAMTAFTENLMINGGIEADFWAQKPICEKFATLFTEKDILKLTTPAGTNLEMNINNRKGNALTCIVDKPGMFSPVPNIESNVSPIEGTANGIIVVDASIPYLEIGLLKQPVKMKVENGYITEITGGIQSEILKKDLKEKKDPNVYNIAEIGVGLNPKSRMTGVMLDDEGVLGSAHVGIGTNITLGGEIKAAIHYDLLLWKPTIELDKQVVMHEGEIRFST
jgi:leucyl aminopeptidase (aminopeptidase T)